MPSAAPLLANAFPGKFSAPAPAQQPAQPSNDLSPEGLKARIVAKYPSGTASDGTPYAQMDAHDLAQRIATKYPNGVTSDGHKYSEFLGGAPSQPAPQAAPNPSLSPFQSPLQNIASGNSQANLEGTKGLLKGALSTFASAGAQNAGPVGAAMTANAPKLAEAFKALNQHLMPSNPAQAFGAGSEKVAEGLLPIDRAAGAAPALKELVAPARSPVKIAGQIVQGKSAHAPIAANVLSHLDTSGVKTYADLSKLLGGNIKETLGNVDKAYQSVQGTHPLNTLNRTVTSQAGDKSATASANFVKDALDQLKELYTTTRQPADLARIKALTATAKGTGLSAHDINLLAREYGTEFGSKAFSKTGDPLTSVNAQAFENTRKGIKQTARDFLPDQRSKALDEQVSHSITTKGLVDKMHEAVTKLEQRVQPRNPVQQLARGAAKAIDFATLGAPKEFFTKLFFPSNVGLKTLNSLDLQDMLAKNLKLLQKSK